MRIRVLMHSFGPMWLLIAAQNQCVAIAFCSAVRRSSETLERKHKVLGLFTKEQEELIERMDAMVARGVATRAAALDASGEFPDADFADIQREGLLLATLPRKDGGLGFGFHGDDPVSFYLIIERLAAGNPSTAHCFQVHANSLQILRAGASDEQVARVIEPTRERGKLIVGAGSEPGGKRTGSEAKRVPGGVSLTGSKHYATNATRCEWMTVFVRAENPQDLDCLLVHRDSPGLEIDLAFWNPTGMRACVSPMLRFKECFVPDDCILRGSSGFHKDHWLAKINFGFTANYLGALQAMLKWATNYLRERGQLNTELYQTYIGELRCRLDAARVLFYHALRMTRIDLVQGLIKSNEAKYMAVDCLNRFFQAGAQVMGSTAYFRDLPLERMCRDMQVHMLHRRHHVGATLVGQAELGLEFDLSRS